MMAIEGVNQVLQTQQTVAQTYAGGTESAQQNTQNPESVFKTPKDVVEISEQGHNALIQAVGKEK